MATCRTCERTIHRTVTKCPSCGDPEPHNPPFKAYVGMVLILLLILYFVVL
jgi:RNA polymerase subunit RPABC4/transcription elongation factor Spt4